MTCISAIKNRNNKIIMAGDRRCSWSWGLAANCPEPKIIKSNGFLVGGTGDSDLLELILDGFEFRLKETEDIKSYMTFSLRKDLTNFLKSQGYKDQHNMFRLQRDSEIELLIGIHGKLFIVNFDPGQNIDDPSIIGIGHVAAPFAIGCGADAAYPLLTEAREKNGFNTKQDLITAMERACKQSPGCSSPIDIIQE